MFYRTLTDRFSYFIDLNPDADGPRLRPVTELVSALDYLERVADAQTDILVYRTTGGSGKNQAEPYDRA